MSGAAIVSLVLAVVAAGLAVAWWWHGPRTPRVATLVGAGTAAGALAAALVADAARRVGPAPWQHWLALGATGLLAVVGGGGITVAVLTVADQRAPREAPTDAAEALRGGAWIGFLERLGIFAALVAGYPSAVAVILAIKGLARYPELRAGPHAGIAERFIIGTFTSMLTAAGAAGIARLLLG